MKNKTNILRNLGMAFICTTLFFPVLSTAPRAAASDAKKAADSTVGSPAGTAPTEGAKDLFYRQISNQSTALNTGVQYYIELKRGGKITRVSNKFAFKSGDSIRIHVTSNIDAYAYIVLREGSAGEQSVLFPDPRFRDNNKLKSSVDYSLPQDGALTFDRNPGTENLLLLLSRTPIDATKFLSDKTRKHVVIASAKDGSKDLIPGSVVLAYSNQDGSIGGRLPDLPASSSTAVAANSNSNSSMGSNINGTTAGGTNQDSTSSVASSPANDAVTTLVQKDPTQVLSVNLALMHEP